MQVHSCASGPTDQASGCSVLQVVVLSEQRHDLGEDGFTHQLSFLVFGHDTWSHLDLLTHLEVAQRSTRFRQETDIFAPSSLICIMQFEMCKFKLPILSFVH